MRSEARRVVTGVDSDGRSRLVSDGVATNDDLWLDLWSTLPSDPLAVHRDVPRAPLHLEPGATVWHLFHILPDAEMNELTARHAGTIEGLEADGFHITNSIDYVMILDGDLVLELDIGEVELHPGDCVVQRHTRHAWRNRGDRPVRAVAVIVSVDSPRT